MEMDDKISTETLAPISSVYHTSVGLNNEKLDDGDIESKVIFNEDSGHDSIEFDSKSLITAEDKSRVASVDDTAEVNNSNARNTKLKNSPDIEINDYNRGSTRRRTKTTRFDFEFLDNEDQRLLQQALKISKRETKRFETVIPDAPIYYPTAEEFKNPIEYIEKIRLEASKFGICKIVPPKEWKPSCKINMNNPKLFNTKRQQINTLQEGQGFDDGDKYTILSYKEMADKFYKAWSEKHYNGGEMTMEQLSKDYWDMVETSSKEAVVDYGNDLDTTIYSSGFEPSDKFMNTNSSFRMKYSNDETTNINNKTSPGGECFPKEFYKSTGWNLNNLPHIDGSVLRYLQTPINGVNVPWLYMGMLFASFCWHNEDNYFYSMNYSHFGAVKQWYGVPGSEASTFEKVSKEFLLELFRESPDLLHHMTTQISPSLLKQNGVPVYKMTQEPGTFIITFPKAFHCGFSYGFNCGEAVNFASLDWILSGGEAEERYRLFGRVHQRLLFTLLNHKDDIKKQNLKDLANEILKILNEEIASRPIIFNQGVRDLTNIVNLPSNNFEAIDHQAADYDEMRSCHICKHICIFSAIACECNKSKVGCIRHYGVMCKCSKDKKFMLAWASTQVLKSIRADAQKLISNEI